MVSGGQGKEAEQGFDQVAITSVLEAELSDSGPLPASQLQPCSQSLTSQSLTSQSITSP